MFWIFNPLLLSSFSSRSLLNLSRLLFFLMFSPGQIYFGRLGPSCSFSRSGLQGLFALFPPVMLIRASWSPPCPPWEAYWYSRVARRFHGSLSLFSSTVWFFPFLPVRMSRFEATFGHRVATLAFFPSAIIPSSRLFRAALHPPRGITYFFLHDVVRCAPPLYSFTS